MPSPDAPRLLLFADGPRGPSGAAVNVRRYRLARLQPPPPRRPASEPLPASPKPA